MLAKLDHTQDIAANIRTYWFRPERPLEYIAGQYTELYLPHDNPDERGDRHWFTLSSSPTEPLLGITTKFATDRSSTFKQVLRQLPVGAQVHLAEAMGDFVLPKDKTIPLIFAAGGIGITPMRSMVKYLLDKGERRDLRLLYTARKPSEQAFLPLFAEYGLDVTPLAQEPGPDWQGTIGHLAPRHILEQLSGDSRTLVYLSGPEPMIQTLLDKLQEGGIPKHRLITDSFLGYTYY